MRAEAEGHISQRVGITVLERIVMINLYLAVVTLLVWYVFFAGAPLGKHVPNGHAVLMRGPLACALPGKAGV